MFVITQFIGLAVINAYSPKTEVIVNQTTGQEELVNITPQLPYNMQPPEIEPEYSLITIAISFIIAIIILLLLMTFKAKLFLRFWFFVVVTLAIGITLNALLKDYTHYSSLITALIALPIAFFKIFRRNFIIHNLSELLIYPGLAAVFVPILNIWTAMILLILISGYDVYAVWHSGFMQKMAKFQINELKFFAGFFVPYLGKKERIKLQEARKEKDKKKLKKIKVNLAILGGGDVVFPIVMAGVVFRALGLLPALLITLGASLALLYLFLISKKGKFYPAMPFLTAGILFALAIVGLVA